MRAIAVRRGESAPRVIEKPNPQPAPGEVVVRTLRVGIDGTDHGVIAGTHGEAPAEADHLVLGHEAVGVVEDPNGTEFDPGDIVVPTVRRPPPDGEPNEYFERGEPDMAPAGEYVERGIVGAHGYMAEYFASPADFLVEIPHELAAYGFLVEPLSNAEKALELASAARASFHWSPESAIVLGNGPLGLLTLARLATDSRFDRCYGLGRRSRPDPTIDIIERLGATYVDSRDAPVEELAASHEPMDLLVEATGHARHAFECIPALAASGIAALLGIPDDRPFEIDGGALHRDLVLENKALLGSVNSSVPHFEAATESLAKVPEWFVEALLTGVYRPEEVERAFATDEATIKSAIEFEPVPAAETSTDDHSSDS